MCRSERGHRRHGTATIIGIWIMTSNPTIFEDSDA
jgi:hypothetical protein